MKRSAARGTWNCAAARITARKTRRSARKHRRRQRSVLPRVAPWSAPQHVELRGHTKDHKAVRPRVAPWSARPHVELRGNTVEDYEALWRAWHHGVRAAQRNLLRGQMRQCAVIWRTTRQRRTDARPHVETVRDTM